MGLDWLVPPSCGGCGHRGTRWCDRCQEKTEVISGDICRYCGKLATASGLCPSCAQKRPSYTIARSWAVYDGAIRSALHRLKYKRDIGLGEVLARPMVSLAQKLGWKVDLVIPVPMTAKHLKQRGYNQARLLSKPVAYALQFPHEDHGLNKVRETNSQVNLSISEREVNVSGAFRAEPSIIQDRSILLIDDIMTTGSTLEACSQDLRAGGAKCIYCLTLARA